MAPQAGRREIGRCVRVKGRSALAVLALIAGVTSVTGDVWDPPGIQVHPEHAAGFDGPLGVEALVADGLALFNARFNVVDGAGRPAATGDSKPTPRIPGTAAALIRTSGPDAMSCRGCHNQPIDGGAGDFSANVFVGAHFADPPTESVSADVTNERNTTSLFGTGVVEMLAREMTSDLRRLRDEALADALRTGFSQDVALRTKGVSFGTLHVRGNGTLDMTRVEGVDVDLVVKPFGVKGIAISLREFTIGALNQHHGIQAIERFGWERTGLRDFDQDGVEVEFTIGQLTALTLFQASLSPPVPAASTNPIVRRTELRGRTLMDKVGCTGCHVPRLPLEADAFHEPNPFNRPGAVVPQDVGGSVVLRWAPKEEGSLQQDNSGQWWVATWSDLRRHVICDDETPHFCNEQLRQDNVPTDQFLTARLWDVAATAPYGHRGSCSTLTEAILHHGGEATVSRQRFEALPDDDQASIIRFLLTLGADYPGAQH